MTQFGLSRVVVSYEGDPLCSFEVAARMTATSPILIERLAQLGLIHPIGVMLHPRDIARIAQIQRLRQDLGLNLTGAAIALEMAQEIAQLRAELKAYQSRL